MVNFEVDKNKPPVYVNPLNVFWVQEHGKSKDGRPKTDIVFESGFKVTVDEAAHTVQTRLSDWLDKHRA